MIFQKYFKIKKGKHYSLHGIAIQWPNRHLSYKFRLSSECWYQKEDLNDSTGVNKIIGRSYGLNPSKNSVRIGWQPVFDQPEYCRLYLYIHEDGIKRQHEIGTIRCGLTYDVDILIKDETIEVYLDNKDKGVWDYKFKNTLGWKLYPYFGGKSVAPRGMFIYAQKN